MLFLDRLQQSLAGIFQQIQNQLETRCPAVVGIRYVVVVAVLHRVVGHHVDFSKLLLPVCHRLHVVVVILVHHDDVIKFLEIGCAELACPATEAVVPFFAVFPHTIVGQLTLVPTGGSCRVYLDEIPEPVLFYQLFFDYVWWW